MTEDSGAFKENRAILCWSRQVVIDAHRRCGEAAPLQENAIRTRMADRRF
jgi:hypothetical protein